MFITDTDYRKGFIWCYKVLRDLMTSNKTFQYIGGNRVALHQNGFPRRHQYELRHGLQLNALEKQSP